MPSKKINQIRGDRGSKEVTFLMSTSGGGHTVESHAHTIDGKGFKVVVSPESRYARRAKKRQEARQRRKLNRKNK